MLVEHFILVQHVIPAVPFKAMHGKSLAVGMFIIEQSRRCL